MINISYIFRKSQPQFNSIEELFSVIIAKVKKEIHVSTIELPEDSMLVRAVCKNFKSIKKTDHTVYHITGHVSYTAIKTWRKTVWTIHDVGSALHGNGVKILITKLLLFWIPALIANKITVVSEFTKNEVLKLMPFVKNKLKVIHNPVNPSIDFKPKAFNENKPVILQIGTKPNKNLERTLEALEGLNCKLKIIGELTNEQKKLILSNEIEVENCFNLTYEEIIKCYEDCDILCFASTYEGFGMPIIEAQAVGRPVITSTVASMPEVAGEGAYLVDPYSVTSIKKGIEKVIYDTAYRNELIRTGKENIKRFEVGKIASQYLKIYEEL